MPVSSVKEDGRQCVKHHLAFPQLDLEKNGNSTFNLLPHPLGGQVTFYHQPWAHNPKHAWPEGFGRHHHPLAVAPHTPRLAGLGIY